MNKFVIRRISAETVKNGGWFCGELGCCTRATFYLVSLPNQKPLCQRESRVRRCETHARQDAQSLHIPFPSEVKDA